MKFPAWYGIGVGVLMIGQWAFSIAVGSVSEFENAPWEIAFHLAAEISTAVVLIIGGISVLCSIAWSKPVLLLGLGMVIYSETVSPGYFAQLNQWAFVAMFAVLLFGAVWSAMLLLRVKAH
jgi:cellulose synthase/poly-beta-1,6-N-acetylglucosamine synthase-like glycosyltransferase